MTARLLYDVPEAAEQLNCSVDTVYRLVALGPDKGGLRRVDLKVSGAKSKTRIRHEDLVAFIESRIVA